MVDVADIDCEWLRSSQYIQNTRILHGTLEQRTRYLYPRRSKTSKYPNSSSTVKKIKKKKFKIEKHNRRGVFYYTTTAPQ